MANLPDAETIAINTRKETPKTFEIYNGMSLYQLIQANDTGDDVNLIELIVLRDRLVKLLDAISDIIEKNNAVISDIELLSELEAVEDAITVEGFKKASSLLVEKISGLEMQIEDAYFNTEDGMRDLYLEDQMAKDD
jgi:hypothetical protein